ncbi:MAG: HlyD family secretion protein [Balneolaceae bacterium]|nr:HlyD family secretion protein [Balneolaceae bacterium]
MDPFLKNDKKFSFLKKLTFFAVPVIVVVFLFLQSITGVTKFTATVKYPDKYSFISDERVEIVQRHVMVGSTLQSGTPLATITSEQIREETTNYLRLKREEQFYKKIVATDSVSITTIEKLVHEQKQQLRNNANYQKQLSSEYRASLLNLVSQVDSLNQALLLQSETLLEKEIESKTKLNQEKVSVLRQYIDNKEKLYQLNFETNQSETEPGTSYLNYSNALQQLKNSQVQILGALTTIQSKIISAKTKFKQKYGAFEVNPGSITILTPKDFSSPLTYLNTQQYVESGSILFSYLETGNYYFEAHVSPHIALKISENKKAKIVFRNDTFLDISLIDAGITSISTTANENGQYQLILSPTHERDLLLFDQLKGTAFTY